MKKRELLMPVLVTGIMTFLVFLAFNIFPYGKLTIAWCDAYQQVVPLLLDLKDILEGRQSVMLNLQNAGGMDLWSVLFFFVSSPLHLLVVFVPKTWIFQFFQLLILVKMMLCSLTAYYFLRRRYPRMRAAAVTALACMYAFSGYILMFYQNIVWLDAAYLFPLLMVGLDRMLDEGKPGLYMAVLVAELYVNYYLSYMVVIFLLLYVGMQLSLITDREKRARGTIRFVMASLTAALLTAPVWLPCLKAFGGSARGRGLITNLMNSALAPSLATTIPFLYCTGIFIPALAFFPWKKADRRQVSLLVMTLLLILPLFLEPVNKIWHTGDYQCFPARYGYMTVMMMLLVTAEGLEAIESRAPEEESRRSAFGVLTVLAVTVMLAAGAYFLVRGDKEVLRAYPTTLWGTEESFLHLSLAWLIMMGGYLFCLLMRTGGRIGGRAAAWLLLGLFAVESFFQGGVYMGYPASDQSHFLRLPALAGELHDADFYRIKMRTNEVGANWPGASGLPTLSHYTSLTGEDYMFSLRKLGYSTYWMEADSQGGTVFTDALLSNRYTLVRTGKLRSEDVVAVRGDYYSIVRNPYELPPALVTYAPSGELAELPEGNRAEAQNALYRTLFGKTEDLMIRYEPTELRGVEISGARVRRTGDAASGIIEWEIEVTGEQHLYFDCFGGRYDIRLNEPENKSCEIWVNERMMADSYPLQKVNGLYDLGVFRDRSVHIRVILRKDLSHAVSFGVYGLRDDLMRELCEEAEGAGLQVEGNLIRTEVSAAEGAGLVIMLPYRDGYSARVNGREAAVKRAMGGFLMVELQQGDNVVEIRYMTPGLKTGLILGLAGLAAVLVWITLGRRLSHRVKPAGGMARAIAALPYIWLPVMVAVIYLLPMAIMIIGHLT
ncbi:MAG: YfhO family protein [Firmicutes bacterium]|nr:YfhO family protein [Bacillota bacterium]